MDHPDRGRGELARYERQDSDGRGDPATNPWPADPYSRPDPAYRTPSRRRARHRGAADPVDSYTPSWARETASQPIDAWSPAVDPTDPDGGRHHRAESAGRRGPDGRPADPPMAWQGSGDYWRAPGGTAASTGEDSADDRWSGRGGGAARQRDTDSGTADTADWRRSTDTSVSGIAETPGWRRGTDTGGAEAAGWRSTPDTDASGAGSADVPAWRSGTDTGGDDGAAGRHGLRREDAGWHGGDANRGWSTGASPTDGGSGQSDERPSRGRRRRADPDVDAAAPTSGWAGGAASPPDSAGYGDPGRSYDSPRPGRPGAAGDSWREGTVGAGDSWREGTGGSGDSWRGRTEATGDSWRSRLGEPGDGRVRGEAEPGGRGPVGRRRAEPGDGERDDPARSDPPSRRGRSGWRARADVAGAVDPYVPDASAEPTSAVPGGTDPAEQSGPAKARWVRSPYEVDVDPPSRTTPRRSGWTEGTPQPWDREPDAEPVRRRGRDAGPVRRPGDDDLGPPGRHGTERGGGGRHGDDRGVPTWQTDRGTPGRHSTPAPELRRADSPRRSRSTDPGPWDRLTDTGTMDPISDAGPVSAPGGGRRRDRSTDTGQWDRFTDTTEWRNGELDGLARAADADAVDAGRTGFERGDTFWSGTRLAGDDPRWMGIPDSAPRSPAVAYPPPGGSTTPTRRRVEPGPPTRRRSEAESTRARGGVAVSPRGAGAGTTTGRRAATGRRPVSGAARRQASPLSRRLEDDLLDPRPSGPLTAVLYTGAWYAVAALAILVWVLTLDASVPAGCVPGVSGGCESERGQAVTALLDAVPRFAAALATGLVVAAVMRWFNRTWRAVTIGLSAAVVGGGLSTVLFSVISGQPLG